MVEGSGRVVVARPEDYVGVQEAWERWDKMWVGVVGEGRKTVADGKLWENRIGWFCFFFLFSAFLLLLSALLLLFLTAYVEQLLRGEPVTV